VGVLKARLAKTIDYCKTFKPAQIDGTEDKDITIKLGANERKFTGQGLLQNFILPNFYLPSAHRVSHRHPAYCAGKPRTVWQAFVRDAAHAQAVGSASGVH
jgi:hypothetical protein